MASCVMGQDGQDGQDALPVLLGQKGKAVGPVGDKLSDESFLNQIRLFYACAAGDPVNTKRLLEITDVNFPDHNGRTALHSACGCTSAGAKETVKLLLKKQADVNAVDSSGTSAIDIAVKVKNRAIRRILEEKGGEVQVMLERRGRESAWLLDSSELTVRKELANTLKSTVHLADWLGTSVVVKTVKRERRKVLTHMTKSASFCAENLLGLGSDSALREDISDEEGENIRRACQEELLREIELVASFRHPDLVLFLGACLDPGAPVMFVTEYMPRGDVERYMFQQREVKQVAWYTPPLSCIISWCCAVARALAFLHKFPVLHRDLKPMNLLLTQKLEVKVSDFGTGRLINKVEGKNGSLENAVTTALTMGTVGTFAYTAPEMLQSSDYNEKVDIYAFALIMYYLSSGRPPFKHIPATELIEMYSAGKQPRPDAGECHRVMRGLVQRCWAVEPKERPEAVQILKALKEIEDRGHCDACSTM